MLGFPGGSEVNVSACNAGGLGSIPGLGRSPGEGNVNPIQYSCLGNPKDRGAWRATVHGVTKELKHNLVIEQKSNIYIYIYTHIPHTHATFFIRSSVDGHCGCSHALEAVNNTAVNNEHRYLFKTVFLFLLALYLGVELVDPYLFFFFFNPFLFF